jgi:MFS family permease
LYQVKTKISGGKKKIDFFSIIGGWLSITMGAKSICAMSLCISSLATIALSSIYFLQKSSFLLVVCLRVLIGAAHGTVFPITYTLWAHWAVPDERGTLSSIGFSGTQLGTCKKRFDLVN